MCVAVTRAPAPSGHKILQRGVHKLTFPSCAAAADAAVLALRKQYPRVPCGAVPSLPEASAALWPNGRDARSRLPSCSRADRRLTVAISGPRLANA